MSWGAQGSSVVELFCLACMPKNFLRKNHFRYWCGKESSKKETAVRNFQKRGEGIKTEVAMGLEQGVILTLLRENPLGLAQGSRVLVAAVLALSSPQRVCTRRAALAQS